VRFRLKTSQQVCKRCICFTARSQSARYHPFPNPDCWLSNSFPLIPHHRYRIGEHPDFLYIRTFREEASISPGYLVESFRANTRVLLPF
uniref:Uncharacterized protein n=1 Tax=Anopheles funestus TaxID=62324 RepID=A0A182S4C4_ANOFN